MDTGDYIFDHSGDFPDSARFSKVGDSYAGVVDRVSLVDTEDLNTRESVQKLVAQITTDGGDRWSVWFNPGSDMIRKLGRALRTAKPESRRPTLDEGDHLSVRFDRTEPASKKGFADRKLYEVIVKPGDPDQASEVSVEDLVS